MLALCSNGISSKKLSACIAERLTGCKTAALVVTADNKYKEKNYHVKRCADELEALGLAVELFDLDVQPACGLLVYDVVEFIGGNPYYLLQAIRRSDAADVLKQIAANKVLIGWSAAVFVFGPTLELVDEYSPELNFLVLKDLQGLGLTEIEVLPHYSRFLERFERFEERCRAYEERRRLHVIRLNDGEGVLIDGENVEVCRFSSDEK